MPQKDSKKRAFSRFSSSWIINDVQCMLFYYYIYVYIVVYLYTQYIYLLIFITKCNFCLTQNKKKKQNYNK